MEYRDVEPTTLELRDAIENLPPHLREFAEFLIESDTCFTSKSKRLNQSKAARELGLKPYQLHALLDELGAALWPDRKLPERKGYSLIGKLHGITSKDGTTKLWPLQYEP